MLKTFARYATLTFLAGIALLPAQAQSGPAPEPFARDPQALAARLLGYNEPFAIPDLNPTYAIGDTLEFWVAKEDSPTPNLVSARLAAAGANVYLWVEDGIDFDAPAMATMAQQMSQLVTFLQLRETYGDTTILPGVGPVRNFDAVLPMPDVDNDPHLYILYSAGLSENRESIYNPNDSLPIEWAPGGYSNQRELITINTLANPNSAPSDDIYLNVLARAIHDLLISSYSPDEAVWLREAFGTFLTRQLQENVNMQPAYTDFLAAPNTPLTQPPSLISRIQTVGAQQLFFDYVMQRLDIRVLADAFGEPGDGLAAFESALAQTVYTDPVSGAPITADDIFADFVIANLLNSAFGDGRYMYTSALERRSVAAARQISDLFTTDLTHQSVNQYGTQYYELVALEPAEFTLTFTGSPTTPRLPLSEANDPQNNFYWSGDDRGVDHTLTRSFDLSDVDEATLEFDVWYELAPSWSYAYLMISTDNGATWNPIRTDDSSLENRYGVAYGPGFTGISNPAGPTPFPALGVEFSPDGSTIQGITPGGALEGTEIQAGDIIAGYNGQAWVGRPNVLGMLNNYAPGDTLNLLIQRGSEAFDVPVTLGPSTLRFRQPDPLWLHQEADLSAYTGLDNVLVRFEYISLPNRPNHGVAIDNMTIEEIGFTDDAESAGAVGSAAGGWELAGWQRVNNQVEQRYLVQTTALGGDGLPPSVRQLIGTEDDATEGDWRISLSNRETLIVAVSGLNNDTTQPASFDLVLSSE